MSNRSLIEINHDFCSDLGDPMFVRALQRYLRSASRENADGLRPWGARVVGMRHHSTNFIIDGTPDGFPVMHLTPTLPLPDPPTLSNPEGQP